MKIEFILDAKLSNDLKTKLYNHLKSKKLNGVESIDWVTSPAKPGEMGNGAGIQAIGSLISNSQTGIVELFKTLQTWINLYKQEITIKSDSGLTFAITTRQLDDSTLKDLVEKFLATTQVVDKKKPKSLPAKTEKPKKELPPESNAKEVKEEKDKKSNVEITPLPNTEIVEDKKNKTRKN